MISFLCAVDHSRVVLKVDIGRPRQADYINANYVDVSLPCRPATEGSICSDVEL